MTNLQANNRVEEALYGGVGVPDCYKVGMWGGCGLDCWVYQEGRCGEPTEIIEGVTDQETIEQHNKLYGGIING